MRELLNYREAFNLGSEYLNSGETVTVGLIRERYNPRVSGVRGGPDGPGAYRTVQSYVAISRNLRQTYDITYDIAAVCTVLDTE